MNETNNNMELNTPEVQKRKEKEANSFKNKLKSWKEKRQEKKEEKKRAKEEKARVKEQEKLSKESQVTNSAFTEQTVTNDTIMNKNVKLGPTSLEIREEREKKLKRKKFIRSIMTIPEILLVIILALFLKNRYVRYAADAHQKLTFMTDPYIFEITRDGDDIKVIKNKQQTCETSPCENLKISEYNIEFDNNKMKYLQVFMDITFKLKSGDRTLLLNDIKTDFGKKCIYSMVNNKEDFLKWKSYHKYKIIDFEQLSNFTTKGFKYTEDGDKKYLYIATGEKTSSGYNLIVNRAIQEENDLYFYIEEQTPSAEEGISTLITHPLLKIELEETPKNIYVYNVCNGEEYINYDSPRIQKKIPSDKNNTISNFVGDLAGSLRDEIIKEK